MIYLHDVSWPVVSCAGPSEVPCVSELSGGTAAKYTPYIISNNIISYIRHPCHAHRCILTSWRLPSITTAGPFCHRLSYNKYTNIYPTCIILSAFSIDNIYFIDFWIHTSSLHDASSWHMRSFAYYFSSNFRCAIRSWSLVSYRCIRNSFGFYSLPLSIALQDVIPCSIYSLAICTSLLLSHYKNTTYIIPLYTTYRGFSCLLPAEHMSMCKY
jgi:hypothetical protein